jgi:iron(III) transport system ATP-binding protein
MKPLLQVENLVKTYRGAMRPAVDRLCFGLEEGRVLALVGESGSGKTTVLRLLAGLETPDGGEIRMDGEVISRPGRVVEPERRGIGLVFQNHALFPHLTVEKNISYGLRKLPAAARAAVVGDMLDLVRLAGMGGRYPHELSGGERQRVALARALAPQPRLLLLDEPFSSLDARLRKRMRDETRSILRERGTTALFVTHDTGDALAAADAIVVLREGVMQQTGAPPEVYHAPANDYVASFFGTCNFLPFHSLPHPSGARILCHIGPPAAGGAAGAGAGLWVRPEDLELQEPSAAAADALRGEVSHVRFGGAYLEVTLRCRQTSQEGGGFEVVVRHHAPTAVHCGETWCIVPRPRRGQG